MDDFTSSFWPWFVAVTTVVSLVALVWLIRWMTTARKPGEEVDTTGHVWDEDLKELNNPLPRWWLNLFYLTIAFGAVYLVLYPGLAVFPGVLDWSDESQYEREMAAAQERYAPIFEQYLQRDIKALIEDPQAVKIGQRLFSAYCTSCHGSDARGVRGFPNLTDNDWLYGGTAEAIETSILDGRQGVMPAWKDTLGREGVLQVAEYVRQLSGRTADPTVATRGKELYGQHCAVCHGAEGSGNQALGAPNLTDNVWLYGGTQEAIVQSIAEGRQGRMPAHREFLGEAKAHLLAAYVYSLSVGAEPPGS